MEKPKQPVGRPRGRVAVHKASVYLSDAEYQQARELAAERRLSVSGLIRQLLRESASRGRRKGTD